MPIVSVIIPTHNRATFLKRAVKSVMTQSYTDFELIVVDDFSTDETESLILELTERYPNLIVERLNKPCGGNVARNRGAELSSGKYLAFLDDDDIWNTFKLEKQIISLDNNHADLSYTYCKVVGRNGETKRYVKKRMLYPENFKKSIMFNNFIGTTSSIVVKKDSFNEICGFDENLPAFQDYDLYIRLAISGAKIDCVKEALVDYTLFTGKAGIAQSPDKIILARKIMMDKFNNNEYFNNLKKRLTLIYIRRCITSLKYLRKLPVFLRDLT